MARKQPTADQKAAAQVRRDRFKELAKVISGMSEEERTALSMRFPITNVDGRTLSPFNCCLIDSQRMGCTVVGGFRQWLAQGRCVKKGEHGVMIWVPIGGKKKDAAEAAEGDSDGDRPGFIPGTVFDISQTQAVDQPAADCQPVDESTPEPSPVDGLLFA